MIELDPREDIFSEQYDPAHVIKNHENRILAELQEFSGCAWSAETEEDYHYALIKEMIFLVKMRNYRVSAIKKELAGPVSIERRATLRMEAYNLHRLGQAACDRSLDLTRNPPGSEPSPVVKVRRLSVVK